MKKSHSRISTLYREYIIEHSTHPHNYRVLDNATATAHVNNRLCGDDMTLYCRIVAGHIEEASFTGTGCAIMKASASLLTDAVMSMPLDIALELAANVQHFLNGDDMALPTISPFQALSGVRGFPSRINCALLPFSALRQILTTNR
ncbi:MAG: SUF system NifU family Fe-S cluster assembly protein [Bacteroidota bacterium]|nr:SUF system NifU family Fe-S cluster assembly protein [Candidatus Kapabacteria bacterium]MDW8220516.1 SUF system NifU family Fe-S cluster assembly protein [Bacteroidota bacterium]